MNRIISLVAAACIMVSCAGAQSQPQSVTLDEKIGQLLVVGFIGTEPSQIAVDAIEKYRVGGFIFFDANVSDNFGVRNIESFSQTKALVDSLQGMAKRSGLPELFISIDQEGGKVNRLKEKYGFIPTKSAWELGQIGSADTTFNYSLQTAEQLRELGININFAPCSDLAVNPNNPIIAKPERSFSKSGSEVALHDRAWVKGHHQVGIITSLKHFPGHGSSVADSHLGLVDITSTWSEEELEPYTTLIGEGYDDIVMIGHLFNSNIDPEYPASLSKKAIDILRNDMHYDGVIATDDMNMGAIVENYSLPKALELALNAGVDMVIMGNNAKEFENDLIERTVSIIKELVQSGKVSESRIDEAYRRIKKLKSEERAN